MTEQLKILDAAAIRAATSRPRTFEVVNLPSMGGAIKVWKLYVNERDAWETSLQIQVRGKGTETNTRIIRASLLSMVLRNDDGSRMFTDGDIPMLGKLFADEADEVFAVACRLNGLNAKNVEDMAKNSEPTLNGEPSSA